MTADELTELHPRLFHLTAPGNGERILRHGLHPACSLVGHLSMSEQQNLIRKRRHKAVPIVHPEIGRVVLNDNIPTSEVKLAKCLDDGLAPADWLEMLNGRVFFFTKLNNLEKLENARAVRGHARDRFVIDTRRLAAKYAELLEITPINTGNTLRKPARRGLETFAPLLKTSYAEWRRRRPKKSLDTISEVVVRGSIPDFSTYVIDFVAGGAH
jgi:hypothetical protein